MFYNVSNVSGRTLTFEACYFYSSICFVFSKQSFYYILIIQNNAPAYLRKIVSTELYDIIILIIWNNFNIVLIKIILILHGNDTVSWSVSTNYLHSKNV